MHLLTLLPVVLLAGLTYLAAKVIARDAQEVEGPARAENSGSTIADSSSDD